MRRFSVTLALLAFTAAASLGSIGADADALVRTGAIALPNVEGRIDHLAFDPARERLFVAALGNGTIEVIDVATEQRVASLPGFDEPQGIAFLADRNLVAVANGGSGTLQLLDAEDFRLRRKIEIGADADNVRYDAEAGRVLVGFADGLASVDLDGDSVSRLPLPGHAESFQLDPATGRVYVNVPDAERIVVADPRRNRSLDEWPVAGARSNYPMALDAEGHTLFVGCRRPAAVLVYDTETGQRTGSLPSTGDADDVFYDAARQRLYVIGGDGNVDVLQHAEGSLQRIAQIATAPGARTGLLVPARDRLFVAVPHRGSQRAEILVFALQ